MQSSSPASYFAKSFESKQSVAIAISIILIFSALIYKITFPGLRKKMEVSKEHTRALYAIFFLYFGKAILFAILTMMGYSSHVEIVNIREYFSMGFIVLNTGFDVLFFFLNINIDNGNNCFECKTKRVFELIITGCVLLLIVVGNLWGDKNVNAYPDWEIHYYLCLEVLYLLYFSIRLPGVIIRFLRSFTAKNEDKLSLELEDLSKDSRVRTSAYCVDQTLIPIETDTIDPR